MPSTIEQVHRTFRNRGFTVVAVNIQEDRAKVAAWVKEKNVTVTVVLDRSGAVTRQYGVTGTPTVFLVGRDGRLIGKAIGDRGWTTEKGRALFLALVGS